MNRSPMKLPTPNTDEARVPLPVFVTNVHDKLDLLRNEANEKRYKGAHVTAVLDTCDVLDEAYSLIERAGDTRTVRLGAHRTWLESKKAEAAKNAVLGFNTLSELQRQGRIDAAVRDVVKDFERRALEEAEEALREDATDIEKRATESMKTLAREVSRAWDAAIGPATFKLTSDRPASEVALEVQMLREELRSKRMGELLELLRNIIRREEEARELIFTLAAMPLVNDVREMPAAKLAARLARGGLPRSGEADRELTHAIELSNLIEQRRRERVPEDVLFAKAAEPICMRVFDLLIGYDQAFMPNVEFAQRFLSGAGRNRPPSLEACPGWVTRCFRLPSPTERKLVGLPR